MELYVARAREKTVISRTALRVPDGRRVRRRWSTLVEVRVPDQPAPVDRPMPVVVGIGLPPVLVTLVALRYLGIELAILLGGVLLLVLTSLVPAVHRRRRPRPAPVGESHTLTAAAERTAFDRAVATADRISETWPALGNLVDVAEAETLLAGALWEISGVLARRQELSAVLAELTRPDFAGLNPADGSAEKLRAHIRATKEALSAVEIDLASREASLRRAEEAGRAFIREQQMRQAIRAAEQSLHPDALAALPTATSDAAAELAEQTNLVITAYRELTAGLRPDLPA